MFYVNEKWSIPLKDFQFSFARGSGPGGQNVNKLNTKVTLRWQVKETKHLPPPVVDRLVAKYARRISREETLIITSHRFRDQGRNVADCLNKLREMIESVATAPKPRKKTKKPASVDRKRLKDKRINADKKRSRRNPSLD